MPEHGSHRPSRRGERPEDPNPLVAAVAHHLHMDETPGGPAGPPRDPGGPFSGMIAWILLIAAIVVTVAAQWSRPAAPLQPAAPVEVQPPGGLMLIAGRYAVGATNLGLGMTEELADQLVTQLDGFAAGPADELRVAIVESELIGREPALKRLAALEEELRERVDDVADGDPPSEAVEHLLTDIESTRMLVTSAPVAPPDPDGLRERHGFFGELALASGLPPESPARERVISQGRRTVWVAIVGISGFGALCLVGFALGIAAIVLMATRKLKRAYAPPAPGGSVYLEVFVVFILGFLLVTTAAGYIQQTSGADLSRALIWLLLLVPFYALLRGAPLANFKYAMGWHRGKGFIREIGSGVVGYVACLPIFLLGIALTLLTGAIIGMFAQPGEEGPTPPSHPIIDQVDPANLWSVLSIYAVAAVWAPLVEESIFRGALYHHLRGRLGVLLSAVGVAFLFAIIHPQGIIAVPALMSLAVTFALLREWRGSLVAPITAHALHNGALMTGLILALS